MQLLVKGFNYFHKSTHGYFLARPHLRGPLLREVFFTIYDLAGKAGSRASLFVSNKVALLVVANSLPNLTQGLYALEKSDTLTLHPPESNELKAMLNQPGFQYSFNYKTTLPINLVALNNKFLLVEGIQPESGGGKTVINLSTTYIINKDYNAQLDNLLNLLRDLPRAEAAAVKPLPGMSARMSTVTAVAGVLAFIIVIPGLIFGILWIFAHPG